MSNNWSMPRRSDSCATCGRSFEVGETFQAILLEGAEGYLRRDCCLGCNPPDDLPPIGTWKCQRPEPRSSGPQRFDPKMVYTIFQRLDDAAEPQQVQFRFILALLLWRKKVLKLERSASDGQREIWEFGEPGNDTRHRVERPALDDDQLDRLSEQLELLLAGQPSELDAVAAEHADQPEEQHEE